MNSKLVLEVESKAAPEGQVELEPGKSPLNFDVVLLDVLDDHVEFAVELEDFFVASLEHFWTLINVSKDHFELEQELKEEGGLLQDEVFLEFFSGMEFLRDLIDADVDDRQVFDDSGDVFLGALRADRPLSFLSDTKHHGEIESRGFRVPPETEACRRGCQSNRRQ